MMWALLLFVSVAWSAPECTWVCGQDSQLSTCPNSTDFIKSYWVCDYPGCNTTATPCGSTPSIHAIQCCNGSPKLKEKHVTTEIAAAPVYSCGVTGSSVRCPLNHIASGLCVGDRCSQQTTCKTNVAVQCKPISEMLPCFWIYIADRSELVCGDGMIAGFCDTYPRYDTLWGCQLEFERNSFGIVCCFV